MKEMFQKLNVVKCATSEEQKKALIAKGFLPVKGKKTEKGQGEKPVKESGGKKPGGAGDA